MVEGQCRTLFYPCGCFLCPLRSLFCSGTLSPSTSPPTIPTLKAPGQEGVWVALPRLGGRESF